MGFFKYFAEPGVAAGYTFLVSALALFVSFLAWYSSFRSNRKINRIESDRDKKEAELSKTAAVTVAQHLYEVSNPSKPSLDSGRQGSLVITNTGQAAAEGIRLYLTNPRTSRFLLFQSDEGEMSDEIRPFTLGPHSSITFIYVRDVRDGFPNYVRVTWLDHRDGVHEYKTNL